MNTLFVCHTLEAARAKFHETIKTYDAELTAKRISYSTLSIEFENARFDFISSGDEVKGRTFNEIIVDEMVTLTEEQRCELYSRKR